MRPHLLRFRLKHVRVKTYSEHKWDDAQHAHDEKHAPLVCFGTANKARPARVRPGTDPTAVQDVCSEEFHREEERLLKLVVDFRLAHGQVKSGSVWGMLMRGCEEAVQVHGYEHRSVRTFEPSQGSAFTARVERTIAAQGSATACWPRSHPSCPVAGVEGRAKASVSHRMASGLRSGRPHSLVRHS